MYIEKTDLPGSNGGECRYLRSLSLVGHDTEMALVVSAARLRQGTPRSHPGHGAGLTLDTDEVRALHAELGEWLDSRPD